MPTAIGARLLGAQTLVSYADVTITGGAAAVQLLAANSNRITAFIFNSGSNAARVGDTNIGASQGAPVQAGVGITIETTDAIYAYSASGTMLSILTSVRP
jgi:hypothetical protein